MSLPCFMYKQEPTPCKAQNPSLNANCYALLSEYQRYRAAASPSRFATAIRRLTGPTTSTSGP